MQNERTLNVPKRTCMCKIYTTCTNARTHGQLSIIVSYMCPKQIGIGFGPSMKSVNLPISETHKYILFPLMRKRKEHGFLSC
ncbi:hypothetical protein EUGRSUZ_G00278 [Eucalyptus grandis]|uniref:Uncharacterized protein n=2 Tax=Eucalyptus grandis TaxID=71139 RepID=A0ACC3K150_EUCGR|nr:hypothetical protein EUGRSUZ_G00278 [Eucalyptus grandis]